MIFTWGQQPEKRKRAIVQSWEPATCLTRAGRSETRGNGVICESRFSQSQFPINWVSSCFSRLETFSKPHRTAPQPRKRVGERQREERQVLRAPLLVEDLERGWRRWRERGELGSGGIELRRMEYCTVHSVHAYPTFLCSSLFPPPPSTTHRPRRERVVWVQCRAIHDQEIGCNLRADLPHCRGPRR